MTEVVDLEDRETEKLDKQCADFADSVITDVIVSLGVDDEDPLTDDVLDALAHAWKWLFVARLKS